MRPVYFHASPRFAYWRIVSLSLMTQHFLLFWFVCRCIAGKQNILICTNGSVLTRLKCAVQREHLGQTAMVTSTQGNIAKSLWQSGCCLKCLCHLPDRLHQRLRGRLRQTLSRKWNVRRRRDSRRKWQVHLRPRLRGGVLSGLHRRLLQQREEQHLLSVHRCAKGRTQLAFIVF